MRARKRIWASLSDTARRPTAAGLVTAVARMGSLPALPRPPRPAPRRGCRRESDLRGRTATRALAVRAAGSAPPDLRRWGGSAPSDAPSSGEAGGHATCPPRRLSSVPCPGIDRPLEVVALLASGRAQPLER